MRRLVLLYPKAWRERYAREFDALLADVQPTWRTALDIFSGAMKMQIQSLRPWMLVPLCAALGIASAITYVVANPSRYESQALFKADGDVDHVGELAQEVMSRPSLALIIVRENLYKTQYNRISLEELTERMKREDIQVRPVADHTYAIAFQSDDPSAVQRTTQRLAVALAQNQGVQLLGPASPAVRPPNSYRWRILFFGLVFGLAAGVFTALFTGLQVWKLAAGFGIAGLLLAVIPWYFVDDVWSSSAVIGIRSGNPAAVQKTIDDLTSLARLKMFAKDWAIDEPWLRENLHIRIFAKGQAVLVQYRHKNNQKAQQVAAKFASMLIDSTPDATLKLLDPASLPYAPIYPNRAMPALLGLLVGVTGAIITGMRRRPTLTRAS